MCKATVQSHKFWHRSRWLALIFVCLFICFLFVFLFVCLFVCSFLLVFCFLDPWYQPEGSYEIGSVHPSVLPSFCPFVCPELYHQFFLGIVLLVFSNFWHDARRPYEDVRDRAGFSRKKSFCPKIGKMGQKMGQKQSFLNILKNCVIKFY